MRAFRESLTWLHTWFGVVVGSVLFAVFWMGTLSVFDQEIDRWLMPNTRIEAPAASWSLDQNLGTYREAIADRAITWNVFFPDDRTPVVRFGWFGSKGLVTRFASADGHVIDNSVSSGASGFFYPFHYTLMLRFMNIGLWLVGVAAMAMLVLCVSGVLIHRKIFVDFFTFRPQRKLRRAVLDLHNVLGVLGLPFHILITLSGLIVFFYLYLPSGWIAVYGLSNLRQLNQDVAGVYFRPRSNTPGQLSSLDGMLETVRDKWPGRTVESVTVYHLGDAAAFVQVNVAARDRIAKSATFAVFDGATGSLLHQHEDAGKVAAVYRFAFGFHVIRFDSWLLRWLYFFLGLFGCGLIATGYLFWIESRRVGHADSPVSVRVVQSIAIGSTTGILLATALYFCVNRLTGLLPAMQNVDITAFFACWVVAFGYPMLRGKRAWADQCYAIAAMTVIAVALNAVTTGDYILSSLAHRYLWPVAGTDLLLLASGAIAFASARRLSRPSAKVPAHD